MKTANFLLALLIGLGLNLACTTRTPEEAAKAKNFEPQLEKAQSGDLVVYKKADNGYERVAIIKRVIGTKLWFEGAMEPEDLRAVAGDIDRFISISDPIWSQTLQEYYKMFQEKYVTPVN